MILRVYVDDSSDEKQEKAVVAGAFIAPRTYWERFSKEWRKRLNQDGLKYFRSSEYYSLRGEFERYRDPLKYPKPLGSNAARALRDDLDALIEKMQLWGMAVAIPLAMYHEVRLNEPQADQIFGPDAFEMALQSLIERCVDASKQEFGGTRLVFICDDSSRSVRVSQIYSSFKEKNQSLSKFIGALVHADDKAVPALQAADLMAHLSREYYMKWLDDPSGATLTRLKDSVWKISAWDRDFMLTGLEHEKRARGL
jgi:hypothetical protein